MKHIPIYQPLLAGNESRYVNECLDSGWISSRGDFVERFESGFCKYIGGNHASSVSNGTVALHVALEALNIGSGDEVIVPTLTYIASVNTIIQTGAKPVYVDSLRSTWQLDPEDVARKITPKTKAVMAVHLYGQSCDMDALVDLCEANNLFLVEDCAEAFGTYYKGRHVGTFGDAATFSFFGNKTITTGEGGMVVCRDQEVHDRVCHLKSQGVSKTREYWHDELAYNYRMTNICAAIGLAQLEQADNTLAKKRQIAAWYRERLQDLPLIVHGEQEDTRHSYWMCSILLDDMKQREPLRNYLKERGVDTRPLFPPVHTMPHSQDDGQFVNAEYLGSRGINLPSYPGLESDDLEYIVGVIKAYFN